MDRYRIKPDRTCPTCCKPMRFARSTPGIGALPELKTYDCKECGTTITEAAGPGERHED
jgi:hypothetical protein